MTLYKDFLLKRGVGLFSRVGLISGDYGIIDSSLQAEEGGSDHVHYIVFNFDQNMQSVLYIMENRL